MTFRILEVSVGGRTQRQNSHHAETCTFRNFLSRLDKPNCVCKRKLDADTQRSHNFLHSFSDSVANSISICVRYGSNILLQSTAQ